VPTIQIAVMLSDLSLSIESESRSDINLSAGGTTNFSLFRKGDIANYGIDMVPLKCV
jgi:hypothetical protein